MLPIPPQHIIHHFIEKKVNQTHGRKSHKSKTILIFISSFFLHLLGRWTACVFAYARISLLDKGKMSASNLLFKSITAWQTLGSWKTIFLQSLVAKVRGSIYSMLMLGHASIITITNAFWIESSALIFSKEVNTATLVGSGTTHFFEARTFSW